MEAARQRIIYGRRRGRPLRKGQRDLFEHFLPELRFEVPETGKLDPATLFPFHDGEPRRDFWLEIGFGAGEHLAQQAQAHPDIGFFGAEVFENGVVRLLAEARRLSLANIRILVDDARLLLAALPDRSLGRAFILFPDPWPKLRHHKRRMVSKPTLDALARTLKDGAELRLATDDIGYLRWMLELAPTHPDFEWLAREARDWRERPEDWPATRYEMKAIEAGRVPYFLRLRRRKRP